MVPKPRNLNIIQANPCQSGSDRNVTVVALISCKRNLKLLLTESLVHTGIICFDRLSRRMDLTAGTSGMGVLTSYLEYGIWVWRDYLRLLGSEILRSQIPGGNFHIRRSGGLGPKFCLQKYRRQIAQILSSEFQI